MSSQCAGQVPSSSTAAGQSTTGSQRRQAAPGVLRGNCGPGGLPALDGRPRSLGTEADCRRQRDHDHRHHHAARSAMLRRPQGCHTPPGRHPATPLPRHRTCTRTSLVPRLARRPHPPLDQPGEDTAVVSAAIWPCSAPAYTDSATISAGTWSPKHLRNTCWQGRQPQPATIGAVRACLEQIRQNGSPSAFQGALATAEDIDIRTALADRAAPRRRTANGERHRPFPRAPPHHQVRLENRADWDVVSPWQDG